MVALSSRAACAHAVEGTRIRNRTLYSTSSTLPQRHWQDANKHDASASVEAEVDAMSSCSSLGRA